MASLKETIQNDMKEAMRARDKERLGTIRLLLAAIKQKEIDEKTTLDDAAVLSVLNKMIKQRRDSFQQYKDAGRDELAAQEKLEMDILQAYMPEQLSEADIETAVKTAIETSQAESMRDMGKVMGVLKPQLEGKADMSLVSSKVKALLNG